MLSFKPLNEFDFELLCQWFNKPHVQQFYSLRNWNNEEVVKKFTPYLNIEKNIKGYIIYFDDNPLGYIQSYPIMDHPWENQDLNFDIVQQGAGFDIFIGEESYLNKGFGKQIIEKFLALYIWPYYKYCVVDPDVRNINSIHLFKNCNFIEHKKINYMNALGEKVILQLLIRTKD